MKGIKKLLTGILAATMVMGSCLTVSAAEVATGNGGSNTITVKDTNKDQKYTVYKLFDATTTQDFRDGKSGNKGIAYTLPEGKDLAQVYTYTDSKGEIQEVKGTDWFSVDTAGYIKANSGITDSNLATENFRQWAKMFGTEIKDYKATEDDENIKFTGLTEGYYFISTTTGSLATITSIAPDQEVVDKNGVTTIDKTEDEPTNDITDVVNYTVTANIVPGSKNVVFHDSLTSGLTLQGAAPTSVSIDADNYTVVKFANEVTDGVDDITISFKQSYLDTIDEATEVVIKYSAKLNENAVVNEYNDAYLVYGENNDIQSDHKTVYESTFKFQVNKIDGESEEALNGAKFVLATTGGLGDLKEDALDDVEGLVTFDKDGSTYTYNPEGTNKLLEANNSILINGLDGDEAGIEYYLYEVTAPAGYNKLLKPIKVIIAPEFDDTDATKVKKYTVTYVINDVPTVCPETGIDVIHEFDVANNQGTLLPSTGGIGTTIFYIIGGILIVAGVAYFIVRRKANAE